MGLTAFNRHRRAKAAAAHKAAAALAVEADEGKTVDEQGPGDKPLSGEMVAMGETNDLGAQPRGSEAMGTEGHEPAGDEKSDESTQDADEEKIDAQAGADGSREASKADAEASFADQAAAAGLKRSSSAGDWRAFAVAHGFDQADADELSRDELVEHFLGSK